MTKVEPLPSGCWRWRGFVDARGYGQFTLVGSRSIGAHRASYALFVGELGRFDVHHRCENEWCVNPEHLEAKDPARHVSDHRRALTTCKRGHPLSGDNLYVSKATGKRGCRTCRREQMRRWRERSA